MSYLCMQTGIAICVPGSPYANGDSFLKEGDCHMHMAIPFCIQGWVRFAFPYAYGDCSTHTRISIWIWGFFNANMHMGNGTTATSPIPVCVRWLAWSPYTYGHQRLAIPVCIQWLARSLYAYGDCPVTNSFTYGHHIYMHMGIWSLDPHMQKIAYGDLCWSPFAYGDLSLKSPTNIRVVYWIGIIGWYRLVFSRYLPYRYQRKSWLVYFGVKILAGAPFSLQKRGLWTPFGALSPPFKGKKGFPRIYSKKKFPETSKKSSRQILQ